jgi:hypothetical protein
MGNGKQIRDSGVDERELPRFKIDVGGLLMQRAA